MGLSKARGATRQHLRADRAFTDHYWNLVGARPGKLLLHVEVVIVSVVNLEAASVHIATHRVLETHLAEGTLGLVSIRRRVIEVLLALVPDLVDEQLRHLVTASTETVSTT